jgi:O-antigen/teichoic acid export membrane protein
LNSAQLAKPPIDRTKRAVAAVASGSFFALAITLLGFWATPRILHQLGSQRFGLSRAIGDLFAYLGLLEFGLSGASRALLAAEAATDDPDRQTASFALTLKAYWRATLWKLAVGVLLIALCPYLLRIGEVSPSEVIIASAIMTFAALSTPSGALMALLSAEQRDYSTNLTVGIQNIIITSLAVVFAWLRWGIPGQMVAFALGTIFLCVVLVWLTRPALRAALRFEKPERFANHEAFARLNRATFWRYLAARVATFSDRVTIGVLMGGTAVTQFHSTIRLTDAVYPHLSSLGNASWPAMVHIHNTGDHELFAKRLREVTTTICGLAVALAVPILTINKAFVDIWLGPGFFAGWLLTTACCINIALLSVINFWEWCFQCTQRVEAIIPVTVVACVANVTASVAGTLLLGSAGPALGTSLASALIVIPWEMRLVRRHFSVPLSGLFLSIAKPFGLGLPYLLLSHWLGSRWPARGWGGLGLFAGASAAGWALIAWFTVFDGDTRSAWRGRIARLLSRLG